MKMEAKMKREHEIYHVGVSLRNIFDELDYAFKVFLGLYKYYHEELKPMLRDKRKIIERELLKYLMRVKKYDFDTAREMLDVILKNDLLEMDYNEYKALLHEIKEQYKIELLKQVDPAASREFLKDFEDLDLV